MESIVLDLGAAKAQKTKRKREEAFKKYLSALKREELQYEANYLLNSVNGLTEPSLLKRSALLMEELASRVDAEDLSLKIRGYAENLRERLNGA